MKPQKTPTRKTTCPKCGRTVIINPVPIAPPWLYDYWTECKCGNWIGESDI